jgi:hypothetical protein
MRLSSTEKKKARKEAVMEKKQNPELRRDFGAFISYRDDSDDVRVYEHFPDIPFPAKGPKVTRPNEYGQMLLNKRKRGKR